MQDSTRQVAAFLGRVGIRAAERQLDLVTRQSLISLWSLGAQVSQHLPQCFDVVAGEIETLERSADPELADSSYLSAPRSQSLEDFRVQYLAPVPNRWAMPETKAVGLANAPGLVLAEPGEGN